jgi:hypothetical protein
MQCAEDLVVDTPEGLHCPAGDAVAAEAPA